METNTHCFEGRNTAILRADAAAFLLAELHRKKNSTNTPFIKALTLLLPICFHQT